MKLRPALVLIHRWFGLLGAVWLFLLGLTGAILVFYAEIDHAINPDLFKASGPTATVSLDEGARRIEAAVPGRKVLGFLTGKASGDIWITQTAPMADGKGPDVFFDPVSGQVRGERTWGAISLHRHDLMPFIYGLHYNLQFEGVGDWFIGAIGFLWVLDHVVSALLSFPNLQRWANSFRIRLGVRGHKRVFDLHRAVGLWVLPVTLIVAATGAYMNLRPLVQPVIHLMSTPTPWPGSKLPERPLPQPVLGFDAARRASGLSRPQGVFYRADRGIYFVNGFDPRDLTDTLGGLYAVVDAKTGKVLERRHVQHGTAADVIDAWALPLHNGMVLGWPGRIAVLLSGVALCGFVVTGLILWSRKRRARMFRTSNGVEIVARGRPSSAHASS